MLILENFSFQLLPYFKPYFCDRAEIKYYFNFVRNYIVLLNNSISPFILFTFNSDIRRKLKSLLRQKQNKIKKQKLFMLTGKLSMNTRYSKI